MIQFPSNLFRPLRLLFRHSFHLTTRILADDAYLPQHPVAKRLPGFITVYLTFTLLSPASVKEIYAQTYPSFAEWFVETIESDPAAWDNVRALISPIKKRLAYDSSQKEVVILPEDIPEVILKPMSSVQQGQDPKLRPFVGSEGESPRLRPFLSSGGFWNWITLNPFLPGHYDVTLEVLTEQGMPWTLTSQAAEVVADASRDPDLFEWKCPAAHAQNDIESGMQETPDPLRGKTNFYAWLRHRLSDIATAQAANDDRLALYQFARALHSIQDLASHRGMDNSEHSWLDRRGEGPDEDMQLSIPLAKALTREFVEEIIRTQPGISYSLLSHPRGPMATWGYMEVKDRLGFSRQLTIMEYRAFKELGNKVPRGVIGLTGSELEEGIMRLKNQWFKPAQLHEIITEFKNYLAAQDTLIHTETCP